MIYTVLYMRLWTVVCITVGSSGEGVSDYFKGPSDLFFLYDNGLWCHQRCFLMHFIHKCMLQDVMGYSSTFFYYTNHHCSTQFKRQGYEENDSTQKEVSSSRCWCYQGEMPRGFFIMFKEIPGLLNYHQGGALIEP